MNKKNELIEKEIKPWNKYKRDENGLLINVLYVFNEDFSINWKAMIPTKYLVLNREKKQEIEQKYSRNFDEFQLAIQEKTVDLEDIDEKYILILLAGIKEVAKLRGFTRVKYDTFPSPDYVAVKCTINWIPNYELGQEIEFSSLADATLLNAKGFGALFLNATGENRAFIRCVRSFLNIHVIGFDELGSVNPIEENQSVPAVSATSPQFPLIRKFEELRDQFKVSFETLRKHLIEKREMDFASEWNTINDVPKDKAYEVLGIIAEILEKKKSKNNE